MQTFLLTLIHLLQVSGTVAKFQGKSRPAFKSSDDILAKMWSSVRASNGIKALLSLLMVKTPLVDADCIRSLACKALCGLSRSDKIRQVIGKLQLFNSGQLQSEWYSKRYYFYPKRSSFGRIQCLPSLLRTLEKSKKATIIDQFGFMFEVSHFDRHGCWPSRVLPRLVFKNVKWKAGFFNFLRFQERFVRVPFYWRIGLDGRLNRGNETAFSNSDGVVWTKT